MSTHDDTFQGLTVDSDIAELEQKNPFADELETQVQVKFDDVSQVDTEPTNLEKSMTDSLNAELLNNQSSANKIDETTHHDEPNEKGEEKGGHGHGHPESNIVGISINQIATVLGAGISSAPFSFAEAGLIAGIFVIILMGYVTDYSLRLLVTIGKITGEKNYESVGRKGLGVLGYILVCFFMFTVSFFACLAYLTIIGDTIPDVITFVFRLGPNHWIANKIIWITLVALLIIAPICMLDDISKLEKFSALSIISELVLSAVVIVECFFGYMQFAQGLPSPVPQWPWENWRNIIDQNIFGCIGLLSFAFVTHHNAFLLMGSLKTPTMRRFNTAIHISCTAVTTIMGTIAFFGCLAYQHETKGNILKNLPATSVQANIARLCMGISMMMTFPIEMFVCRHAFSSILEGTILKGRSIPSIRGWSPKKIWLQRGLVIFLILVAMTISFFGLDLGIILELGGGFAAIMLGYAVPSIIYLRLAQGKLWHKKKIPVLILLIFGVGCFLASTATVLYNIFSGNHGSSSTTEPHKYLFRLVGLIA
jgi:sodium-coupled neutral amino acid transporter 11